MQTGACNNFQGDGDDVGLDIGCMDDHARDQSDDVVKWLSKHDDGGLTDHPQSDSCKYKYPSLEDSNYIRLLVLCASASPKDDLKAFLRHVKLDTSPPFEALSYTWGKSSNPPRKISIGASQINITDNLHDSLKDLRFERKERILWVDAVCINQENDEEKNV
jgi:hypothetical protein